MKTAIALFCILLVPVVVIAIWKNIADYEYPYSALDQKAIYEIMRSNNE